MSYLLDPTSDQRKEFASLRDAAEHFVRIEIQPGELLKHVLIDLETKEFVSYYQVLLEMRKVKDVKYASASG